MPPLPPAGGLRLRLLRRPAPGIAALRRGRPGGFALLLAAVAALGMAHVLVRTAPRGAALSIDPVMYLSTAVNLAGGEGMRDLVGRELVSWPPGYPLLLAAVRLIGIDLLEAARWINAAAFGLTILSSGLWLRRHVRSRPLALVLTAAAAASVPLTDVSSEILSEPIFHLLALLALMSLGRFLRRRAVWPDLALAAALAALAAVVRYQGVALIGTGVLLLLLPAGAPRAAAARLRQAAAFGAAASLPLAAALARNLAVSGTLTGPRAAFTEGQSPAEAIGRMAGAFAGWAVPADAPEWSAPILWAAIAVAGLACAAAIVPPPGGPRATARRALAGPGLPFAGFVLAHSAFLAAVGPWTANADHMARYLLPVYAPLLLAAAAPLDRLLSAGAAGRAGAARRLLAAAALVGAALHAGFAAQAGLAGTAGIWAWEHGHDWHTSPNAALRDSEALAWARAAGVTGGLTWSNDQRLLWLAGRDAAPGRHRMLPGGTEELAAWLEAGGGEAHLVWIDQARHGYRFGDYGYTGFDLAILPGVETLARLPDGLVLRAERGRAFDEEAHRARREAEAERILGGIAAERGEPDVRARFGLYADPAARTLSYVRVPCYPADVGARFFLHVVPAEAGDLPAERRESGFDNLDFWFRERGALSSAEGSCEATVALPGYAVAGVRTGQHAGGERLWLAELEFGAGGSVVGGGERVRPEFDRAAYEELAGTEPDARGAFGVHLRGDSVAYVREPCVAGDTEAPFFLHVVPADAGDLPAERRESGFDNLDFAFAERGAIRDGACLAVATLPGYAIASLRTGQWVRGDGELWRVEITPGR